MIEESFEAFGTQFDLLIDAPFVPIHVFESLKQATHEFELQYSRFIPKSAANQFRNAKAGTYSISEGFAVLLNAGAKIQELTQGAFNVTVATLLEKLGYDNQYRLADSPEAVDWKAPDWSIQGNKLTISGPTVFDIGGIGKGYWIDELSRLLIEFGFPFHLVDGGGDMMATTKQSGEGWRVALAWPGKTQTALGTICLRNQGIAASDTYLRRWKKWNHLINAKTLDPIKLLSGAMAVADNAFTADQITSALMFSPEESYPEVARVLQGEYLVMREDESVCLSLGWQGEFFS